MNLAYRVRYAGHSDVGQKRDHNEDNFFIDEDNAIALVADGMGGHQAGEVASKIIVDTFKDELKELNETPPGKILVELIERSNGHIFKHSQQIAETHGMGSTITAIQFSPMGYHIASVGDSRTYLYRAGELRQVTDDHSFVQLQVQMGLISQEDSRQSKLRHILTRSIGSHPEVEVDLYEGNAASGDLYLLCSDGFHQSFENEQIQEMLQKGPKDIHKLATELIKHANENDGSDNITVILAKIG